MIKQEHKGPVMVIADLHIPFTKLEYLHFLIDVKNKYKPVKVIQIGDMIDSSAVSTHDLNPDAMDWNTEFMEVREWIDLYSKSFPNMIQLVGNHTNRIYKKAKKNGIPRMFLRGLEDVLEFPPGWELVKEYTYDNVRYIHGEGWGGKNPSLQAAEAMAMSTVVGHHHSIGGVTYFTNVDGKQLFAANTGALVDGDSYAFDYKVNARRKDVKGCIIVWDEHHADYIPFNPGDYKQYG